MNDINLFKNTTHEQNGGLLSGITNIITFMSSYAEVQRLSSSLCIPVDSSMELIIDQKDFLRDLWAPLKTTF